MNGFDLSALSDAAEGAIVVGVERGIARARAMLGGGKDTSVGDVAAAPAKRARKAAPRRQAAKVTTALASRRPSGDKRSPDEMAAMLDRLAMYISGAPGLSAEQIAKALAVGTKEIALPMRKLIATKSVRTTGQKRATRYFPA